MDIHLNEKNVRAMADRLRRHVGVQTIGVGKSLEAVSQMLGHPNWDTLCGLLRKEARDSGQVVVARPLTLYVEAFACDEWADGPSWAKVPLDQELVSALLGMQSLCDEKALDQVSRSWFVQEWGDRHDLRLRGEELQVSARSWWISAYPKHGDYKCETRVMDIQWLLDAVQGHKQSEYFLLRRDVLIYDPAGQPKTLLEQLVDEGQLTEDYLVQ